MVNSIQTLLFAIALISFSFSINAQSVCGTIETPEFIQRLIKNKKDRSPINRDADTYYLPVNFINVGNDEGEGRINKTRLYKELCHINKIYSDLNVQFYLHENTINELDSETVYETAVEYPNLLTNYKEAGTVNIFIVNNASSENSLGVTLGYFWPGFDYIVMLKTQMGVDGNTLPHELGHYFSLPHTFRGWDHEPWNEADHGSIVGPDSPWGVPNEYVDGSNCETAADMICDTPADYNLGFGYQGPCNEYNGNCHDPSGVLLAPMEENYMGYFNTCHPEVFTTTQGEVIVQDIINRIGDGNLEPSENLDDLIINTEDFTYTSPAEGETTAYSNEITLEWENIANADEYYIQIDRIPTFTFSPTNEYVTENTFLTNDLTANKKYFWRVWPLNKYATCPLSTVDPSFWTGLTSPTTQIEFDNSLSVYPNPISRDQTLTIDVKDNRFTSYSLSNILGQIVISETDLNVNLKNTVDISNLSSGVYSLNFVGESNHYSTKINIK